MYAVIRSGGKQYKVAAGDVVKVERIEAEPGSEITIDDVLLVRKEDGTVVDAEQLKRAQVRARVRGEVKGEKIRVIKKKRRKNYRRTIGHRQRYTELEILGVEL